jgi:D-aspartate ligase
MRHPSIKQQYRHTDQPVALILGGTAAGALAAIRGLAQHHIPVIAVESEFTQVHIYSKYCQYLRCPSPLSNEQDYVTFLATIGSLLSTKGVLLPTGDIQNLALLRHQSTLEPYYHFTTPSLPIMEPFLNKRRFYETLQHLGIPHPQTHFPTSYETLQDLSNKVSYPCILKPSLSAWFTAEFHTKVLVAHSPTELLHLYSTIPPTQSAMLLQEIIPGDARNNYGYNAYYDHQQTPHGIFYYRRIRDYPPTFGNGCYLEQVDQPELQEPVTKLLRHLDYYGLVDAEFKYDTRDATWKLLEINPRLWMQCGFPLNRGINHPFLAYQGALQQSLPPDPSPLNGKRDIKWLYLMYDLGSALLHLRRNTLTVHEWLQSYNGKKTFALLSRDDPLPFVIQWLATLLRVPHHAMNKSSQDQM